MALPLEVSPDLWLESHQESTWDPLDIWADFQRKGHMCPPKARWFEGWVHPAIWWGRLHHRWASGVAWPLRNLMPSQPGPTEESGVSSRVFFWLGLSQWPCNPTGPPVMQSAPPDSWVNPSFKPSCFWRAHVALPLEVSPDLWLESHQESTWDPLDIWADFQRKGHMCPPKARWFEGWVHPAIWWGRSPHRWPTCEHGH